MPSADIPGLAMEALTPIQSTGFGENSLRSFESHSMPQLSRSGDFLSHFRVVFQRVAPGGAELPAGDGP